VATADSLGSTESAVNAAVERALTKQRDEAVREVEAILDAAVTVAERVAPATPRVADIVAEAGTSNQAFYRYFAGKDDLMRSVFERGVARLHSYLEHQVAKVTDPREQVATWIRGVLHQVMDRTAARQGAAIAHQLGDQNRDTDDGALADVRALLLRAVRDTGSARAGTDTDAIYHMTMGTLSWHARRGTAPTKAQSDNLVEFCLRGLTPPGPR
jgi:AcrR family transcriptional regulator